jgi:hypothetical protein
MHAATGAVMTVAAAIHARKLALVPYQGEVCRLQRTRVIDHVAPGCGSGA